MRSDPTDAEIAAGADAIAQSWRVISPTSRRHLAKLVLTDVLPDHDARVRADERAKVAEEIRALTVTRPGFVPSHDHWAGFRAAQNAAEAITRQHSTGKDPT